MIANCWGCPDPMVLAQVLSVIERRLKLENPTWPMSRVDLRAKVEYMKGLRE